MERSDWRWLNPVGVLMFGAILFHRRTEMRPDHKEVCGSAALQTEPSENVPKESHPKVTTPPTQTANSLGVIGWVMVGINELVDFINIAVSTRIDGEVTDHRRTNSFLTQQAKIFRSPSNPIPRHSPTLTVDGTMGSQQSHNAALTPQQR